MYCFFDKSQKREAINISPGEYFISSKGMLIHTLISSCISIALYDPVLKMGGMNQFLIPDEKKKRIAGREYGIKCIEVMIDEFQKYGSLKSNLQAKLVGGSVFSEIDQASVDRTICFAEEYLSNEEIEITSQSIGGNEIRKVYYYTDSFRILIGKLKSADEDLEKRMADYQKMLIKNA